MLMPNAGWAGSEWMAGQLAERGIAQRVGAKAERVEAGRVVLADGSEEPFDLLLAVPPHRPPAVVAESGLVAGHGWVGVDAAHAGDVRRGRLRDRRRQPDSARERAAAPEGGRDGRAAGAARRPGDRGRAARRASRRRRSTARGTARSRSARTRARLVQGNWYAEPEPDGRDRGAECRLRGREARASRRERLERWFGG